MSLLPHESGTIGFYEMVAGVLLCCVLCVAWMLLFVSKCLKLSPDRGRNYKNRHCLRKNCTTLYLFVCTIYVCICRIGVLQTMWQVFNMGVSTFLVLQLYTLQLPNILYNSFWKIIKIIYASDDFNICYSASALHLLFGIGVSKRIAKSNYLDNSYKSNKYCYTFFEINYR